MFRAVGVSGAYRPVQVLLSLFPGCILLQFRSVRGARLVFRGVRGARGVRFTCFEVCEPLRGAVGGARGARFPGFEESEVPFEAPKVRDFRISK